MSDKEQKCFHEMAEGDNKRYEVEMQNYTPPEGARNREPLKDPNVPKRAFSPFWWFCNLEQGKVKEENPEYDAGDIAKELGRRWIFTVPEVKSKYEALAVQDKARYDKEMTAYKEKKNPALRVQAPVVPDNMNED